MVTGSHPWSPLGVVNSIKPSGAACVGGMVVAGMALQEVWLSPAQAPEDTVRWQVQAVTQRVRFISLRSFASFFL